MNGSTNGGEIVDSEDDGRAAFIRGLREVADFLEASNVPVPYGTSLGIHISDPAGLRAAVRALGPCRKDYDDTYFCATRDFGGGVEYTVQSGRETVCERLVGGTEVVEVPDPDAVAALPKVKQEREVVEWRCDPVLAPVESASA